MKTATTSRGDRSGTRPVRFKRVLVMDRDEMWGRAVQMALSSGGYRVHMAANGEEGISRFQQRPFDLVVVATAMGGGVIERLMRHVNGLNTPSPIVLVEEAGMQGASETWRFLGTTVTLRRPCSTQEVCDAVASLLGPPWVDLPDSGAAG